MAFRHGGLLLQVIMLGVHYPGISWQGFIVVCEKQGLICGSKGTQGASTATPEPQCGNFQLINPWWLLKSSSAGTCNPFSLVFQPSLVLYLSKATVLHSHNCLGLSSSTCRVCFQDSEVFSCSLDLPLRASGLGPSAQDDSRILSYLFILGLRVADPWALVTLGLFGHCLAVKASAGLATPVSC